MEEIKIEEFVAKMKALQQDWDTEHAHGEADDILCGLLRQLGYAEVVDEYDKIDKWFA